MSQGFGLAFRQSDVLALPIRFKLGQCSDTLFERSVEVHPVKIIQVRVGAQSGNGAFDVFIDVLFGVDDPISLGSVLKVDLNTISCASQAGHTKL